MSQSRYRDITLAELVRRSDVVLVVARAEPSDRSVTIDEPDAEHPYTRHLQRFVVRDALTPNGRTLVGTTIEVDGASWRSKLDLHVRYYRDGIGKTVLYESYDCPDEVRSDPEVIVFLRGDARHGFQFAESGAMERVANRASIEQWLAEREAH